MLYLVLLSALLSVAAGADVCAAKAPAGYVNGCSIPGDLPFFFKELFTPACNKHDICYDCAAHFGLDRSFCDQKFHSRMNTKCDHVTKRFLFSAQSVKIVECKAFALTYYEAVHLGGGLHFLTQSASYCSQSWVRSCIYN